MASFACRWVFTHNNYSDNDLDRARAWITPDNCLYAVVGKETAETTETPHLQGFLHLKKRSKISTLKKKLFNAHFEVARGSDEENQKYCTKGGNILLEIGQPAPKNGTNTSFVNATEIATRVGAGEDLHDILHSDDKFMVAHDKHMQYVDRMIEINANKIGEEAFRDYYGCNNMVFWPWQAELYDMLTKEQPDPRRIFGYVDPKGGAGKSSFASMFRSRHNAIRFRGGRPQDIAYAYKRQPVVFFDFPRTNHDVDKMCSLMEQMKDGELFSSKYVSVVKSFAPPHVIVFANFFPSRGAFSEDRIEVRLIEKGKILKCRLPRRDEFENADHCNADSEY